MPVPARAFLLTTELVAAGLTALLLTREAPTGSILLRVGLLIVLAVGYGELTARSSRMQQYLGSGKIFSNPMSVWSYAAALTLPAGWAGSFIVAQYTHLMWQGRRDANGTPYRVVFTAAATTLAQLSAAAIIAAGAHALGGRYSDAVRSLTALAGIPVFLATNLVLLLVAIWLSARPPAIRALIPDSDTLGYELGTLILGMATAEFMLHSPLVTPVVLVLVAILHRSSVVKSLQKTARTDSKTGLLTAAAWTESARATLAEATAAGRSVAVLVLDLDHFKVVNDTHGHLAGDRVLAAVASCLRHELRGHDGIGRFGGEELVAILDGPTLEQALAIADRVRTAISRLRIDDDLQVTVSVGVAHTTALPKSCQLEEIIEHADRALYRAKRAGRDNVQAFF